DRVRRSLPALESVVRDVLQRQGADAPFRVEFGMTDFPAKTYNGQRVPAGRYEAVVVTIGAGKGRNWWCVLFPPLCFVEIGKGKSEANAAFGEERLAPAGDTEVRFFTAELIDTIRKKIKWWFKRTERMQVAANPRMESGGPRGDPGSCRHDPRGTG